jgi:hypothetical protein
VHVPIAFADHDEAIPSVEAVRVAVAKSRDEQRAALSVGGSDHGRQDATTDASPLRNRMNIKVIQQQAIGNALERHEPDATAIDADMPREAGIEARTKPFPRTLGIEPTKSLQARAHRRQPQRQELLEVRVGRTLEGDHARDAIIRTLRVRLATWVDVAG